MPELADLLRLHAACYLERFGPSMLASHRRAMEDIQACRTPAMGGQVYGCEDNTCGHLLYKYHSCSNRSCPKCQGAQTARWLSRRREEILPVRYFHLVFTVPSELRPLFRRHQRVLYRLLMQAAAQALMRLAADPRILGGRIGVLCVLHTWTGAMLHHPHVHCLAPAGALKPDGSAWVHSHPKFLVPVHALSKLLRGRFLALARKALPQVRLPDSVRQARWVVYCKPALQGTDRVLDYLGRYVHRIAITNRRILSVTDHEVTFRFKDRREHCWKTMGLDPMEFMRRFLQHVLPRDFHKVRYFGLWSPCQRKALHRARQLLAAAPEQPEEPETTAIQVERGTSARPRSPMLCPRCHQAFLILVETVPRRNRGPPC